MPWQAAPPVSLFTFHRVTVALWPWINGVLQARNQTHHAAGFLPLAYGMGRLRDPLENPRPER